MSFLTLVVNYDLMGATKLTFHVYFVLLSRQLALCYITHSIALIGWWSFQLYPEVFWYSVPVCYLPLVISNLFINA